MGDKSIIQILREQKAKLQGGESVNPEVGAGKKYKDPTKSNRVSTSVHDGPDVGEKYHTES